MGGVERLCIYGKCTVVRGGIGNSPSDHQTFHMNSTARRPRSQVSMYAKSEKRIHSAPFPQQPLTVFVVKHWTLYD
jgi:hypothetical protein